MKGLKEKIVEILDTNAKYTASEKIAKEWRDSVIEFAENHYDAYRSNAYNYEEFDQFIAERYKQ